jgi:hypothetical protein
MIDILPMGGAQRSPPPISGLYFDPTLVLPDETCSQLVDYLESTHFTSTDVNQVMLFGKPDGSDSGLPPYLELLLLELSELLQSHLPHNIHRAIFNPCKYESRGVSGQPRARQVILNRYAPGEGITPHVDLLNRFDDGILGLSLGSGCVMDFEHVDDTDKDQDTDPRQWGLYLPPGSILVLTGEARYEWKHGIAKRTKDLVFDDQQITRETLRRGTRMSLTFRWLLPDAHIVGEG